jgi:hypothetical protein
MTEQVIPTGPNRFMIGIGLLFITVGIWLLIKYSDTPQFKESLRIAIAAIAMGAFGVYVGTNINRWRQQEFNRPRAIRDPKSGKIIGYEANPSLNTDDNE